MNKAKKILAILENLAVFIFCVVVILFLIQLFCFTSFRIPSDSMEPALKDGDRILVNKMMKGARLFNVFAALDNEDVKIHRMPGWGNFKRNDILVFNFPYQMNRWDSIRMDVMQYYVKRCIALPGDTLEIRGGFYRIRGSNERLGNYNAQHYLADLEYPEQHGIVVGTFPYDGQLGWTIREFGPLPIPLKGQTVMMNRTNYLLYRQLISWEQKKKLRLNYGQVLLGDSLISQYRFKKNYYFVSGDNMANSQDSRYWGMLPEEYIVGKATHIWYSEDKVTEKPCWNRIMTKIK
ncbi:signal peptidase I [Bacteroides sp. A1-P5]|uniref:Signal peptidase I n=1 Tax=Bacteroides vicugnae TaxID=3037989 RepID=A0ABU5HJJ9_9BACE|nr:MULTISPECIES: signal peptidase I [unclassified Bacteroides]MDY7251907.1 signal peptidase I [Bacteroides sp. A1-P5]MDY7256362.1 signal peptidase I [Bacteroides sp. A2-P53]